jgi:hypothetical protein
MRWRTVEPMIQRTRLACRPSKPRNCLGLDRGPHLGQRTACRVNRPDTCSHSTRPSEFLSKLLHPRGRPHMHAKLPRAGTWPEHRVAPKGSIGAGRGPNVIAGPCARWVRRAAGVAADDGAGKTRSIWRASRCCISSSSSPPPCSRQGLLRPPGVSPSCSA